MEEQNTFTYILYCTKTGKEMSIQLTEPWDDAHLKVKRLYLEKAREKLGGLVEIKSELITL